MYPTRDMGQTTIRFGDRLLAELDREADERDVSRSEYIRGILASRHETDGEIDRLRRENDRLQRERRQLLEQREEHTELVRYAADRREREQRREERRDAPIWRRARWYVFGRDNARSSR